MIGAPVPAPPIVPSAGGANSVATWIAMGAFLLIVALSVVWLFWVFPPLREEGDRAVGCHARKGQTPGSLRATGRGGDHPVPSLRGGP